MTNNYTIQNERQDILNNTHLCRMYAKKSCRHCLGRGTITRSFPDTDIFGKKTSFEIKELCRCVQKFLEKMKNE